MWEAKAEYADGSYINRYFDDNPDMGDAEQRYEIEAWLLDRRENCTFYSVDWIAE